MHVTIKQKYRVSEQTLQIAQKFQNLVGQADGIHQSLLYIEELNILPEKDQKDGR